MTGETDATLHDRELLFALSAAHGPVGYETEPRTVVRETLAGVADEVRTDAMGNVVGTIEGTDPDGPTVAVAAHMDEIGFMVRRVTDEGFLRLDALGGWNAEILRAQPVVVHTDDGPVEGVLGAEPAHTRDQDDLEDIDDLAVDLGLTGEDAGERARDAVAVGDVVTLDTEPRVLADCVTGKALDDRAGVYAMLAAGRAIEPDATVHLCATVQEEVGLRGAQAVGVDLDPDLAIAVDGTLERSVPGVDEADRVTTLGDGVAVKRKDATVVPTPRVVEWLAGLAEDRAISHQAEVAANIGTDTGALQNAGGATLSGALSVPVRYHHSPVELASRADLRATVDLLAAALEDAHRLT